MNAIDQKLSKLPSPALMAHVVVGFPSLEETEKLILALDAGGASFIELQIPFSDPIADGEVIMEANEVALRQGVTPEDCMSLAKKVSKKCSAPLLFMTYYNILLAYGVERFCRNAEKAGIAGLIVPDIPPEEAEEEYWKAVERYGLQHIPLVTPLTSEERLRLIAKNSNGSFVYCVSRTGTTGQRTGVSKELQSYLQRVKRVFSRPLAIGFGISEQKQIRELKAHAEIAVVGSAGIKLVRSLPKPQRAKGLEKFVRHLLQ